MRSRVEIERPFYLDGEQGCLYASLGQTDDYLELEFPEGDAGRIREWVSGLLVDGLDLRFREGPPVMVCAMALYVDAEEERRVPPRERLGCLLSRIAASAPGLDFGDLVPRQPFVKVVPVRDDGAARDLRWPDTAPRPVVPLAPAASSSGDRQSPEVNRGRRAGDGMWDLLAEAYLEKSREMARRGQLHRALRTLEELRKQNLPDPRALDLQQQIRQLERREKRRRREPFNPQAVLEVGFSYLLLDRNPEAAEALGQAARSMPRQHLPQLLLGIALHRVGERSAARVAYERAACLKPGEGIYLELLDALEKGLPPIALGESRPDYRGGAAMQEGFWARAV